MSGDFRFNVFSIGILCYYKEELSLLEDDESIIYFLSVLNFYNFKFGVSCLSLYEFISDDPLSEVKEIYFFN